MGRGCGLSRVRCVVVLRFLLPSCPAMFIGTAALVIWLFDHRGARGRVVSFVLLVTLGAYGLVVTAQRHVFIGNQGERRYATIAHLVAAQTEPSAMIFASIHAGSMRYYAGRATVRFDLLDANWFDRAAMWLADHGRHPYVLIEDWEMPAFRKQFAERSSVGRSHLRPCACVRGISGPRGGSTCSICCDVTRPRWSRRQSVTRDRVATARGSAGPLPRTWGLGIWDLGFGIWDLLM